MYAYKKQVCNKAKSEGGEGERRKRAGKSEGERSYVVGILYLLWRR